MTMLNYNNFRSKFNGSGLSASQKSNLWSQYKNGHIHNIDLTSINIRKLVSVIKKEKPKSKTIIRRVSLIRK